LFLLAFGFRQASQVPERHKWAFGPVVLVFSNKHLECLKGTNCNYALA